MQTPRDIFHKPKIAVLRSFISILSFLSLLSVGANAKEQEFELELTDAFFIFFTDDENREFAKEALENVKITGLYLPTEKIKDITYKKYREKATAVGTYMGPFPLYNTQEWFMDKDEEAKITKIDGTKIRFTLSTDKGKYFDLNALDIHLTPSAVWRKNFAQDIYPEEFLMETAITLKPEKNSTRYAIKKLDKQTRYHIKQIDAAPLVVMKISLVSDNKTLDTPIVGHSVKYRILKEWASPIHSEKLTLKDKHGSFRVSYHGLLSDSPAFYTDYSLLQDNADFYASLNEFELQNLHTGMYGVFKKYGRFEALSLTSSIGAGLGLIYLQEGYVTIDGKLYQIRSEPNNFDKEDKFTQSCEFDYGIDFNSDESAERYFIAIHRDKYGQGIKDKSIIKNGDMSPLVKYEKEMREYLKNRPSRLKACILAVKLAKVTLGADKKALERNFEEAKTVIIEREKINNKAKFEK